MSGREKLIQLIQEAVGGCARHWAALIADNLLSNGVGFIQKTPIESLDLSLRAYNALKRAGINSMEELRGMEVSQIESLRGVGVKILDEILSVRNGGVSHENSEKT